MEMRRRDDASVGVCIQKWGTLNPDVYKEGNLRPSATILSPGEALIEKIQEVVQPDKFNEIPNFVDTGVAAGSSTISKKAKDLNNARDNARGEGWTMVSQKQSVVPQIDKKLKVTKE
ncbi:hypothetical protein RND71_009838 [Anisodus tanguticus]|uniref:Uncharacterized protein n=1 Tax=Anisodus tanguticus TaxID=243964 RepID=A0AAE1SG53_9SOLA|nr:hypothetical protein RND71_009838 [Anisodus tanguticus]